MLKHVIGMFCLLTLSVLATALPTRAQGGAEGKPPIYTYVAQWAVPRAQWTDMTKLDDEERPLMDKLLADSTIIGYGSFTNLIHHEGEPTHGSWFTATSMGNILKALDALLARPGATGPVLSASKHWDFFLVSRTYNGHSAKSQSGYLAGAGFDVKPGHGREFRDLVKSSLVPMYEKLLADGAILSYSVDSEEFHTEKPGHVTLVYTTADAGGLDKVDAAIEAAIDQNPALGSAFFSHIDGEAHRDFLLRVAFMTSK